MVSIHPIRTVLAAALVWLLVAVSAPAAARAAQGGDQTTADRLLANYLATHPGGTVLNDNEISYGDGTFVVTLRAPVGTLGVADCPWGWYCFYEWPNYGYPRGRLSDCGRQSLATWKWQFRVESAHYNLSSGSVSFYYYDTRLFDVGTSRRVSSDVTPYRNWANYVVRRCV
ncbi:hypothetical protein GA0070616_3745 [Micromonospora nigra]|uniref:Peptidase inhibitor family I36 n=1 Tax=Micromonospora nigra TaxID=145857 RepID=A0A1C6SH88_9ACTN|nr:hypothetical protein GA0070616_3745 [Micromonospora nigra]